ncbi:MAG: terminase [Anaerolineae bacterium]|nr:terminase [Anaerolineae bacterium]
MSSEHDLFDLLANRIRKLDPQRFGEVWEAVKSHQDIWMANPGAQTNAKLSPADILLYGGAGGGGKSDLGLGLAFTDHRRSLIMRRLYADLSALTERAIRINGTRKGFKGGARPLLVANHGGIDRHIQFGANQLPGSEQSWQGHAFDLKYLDELVQFLESQFWFHLGWLRPGEEAPDQRCRMVGGSNPPIDAQGDWIIKVWRPWLDLTHPNPAKPGELRWIVRTRDETILEVDGPTPVDVPGESKPLMPISLTFIPASTKDNPTYRGSEYERKLDALPEPLRSAVRDGNFMAARKDAAYQVIPLEWVLEAQARWEEDGWQEYTQTVISIDPAGGGGDAEEMIARHGPWFGFQRSRAGPETAKPTGMLANMLEIRKGDTPIIIDVGGGYAGAAITRFDDNEIVYQRFNGASDAMGAATDSRIPFYNRRARALWRLREALDPDQDGGSKLALPPCPELRSDLTAPIYLVRAWEVQGVIQIESKEDIRKRIGRSTGKGDVVAMAWDSETVVRKAAHKRHQRTVGEAGIGEEVTRSYSVVPPGGRWARQQPQGGSYSSVPPGGRWGRR